MKRTHTDFVKKKILVVDANDKVRDACEQLLAQAGYDVETATDGMEALKKLEYTVYDLIITDLNMPGLGGIGLYFCVLKEYPYLPNRFLFVTGDIVDGPKEFPIRVDLTIIEKPFTLRELLYGVKKVLQ